MNEENGYFTKTVYKAGGYSDAIRYVTTQPLDSRKKGFGTKDAKRRDEFSNAIRTEVRERERGGGRDWSWIGVFV